MAAGCSTSWSHTKQTRFIRCPFGSAGGKWAELVGGGRACGNLFDHAKHLFDHAKRSGNGLRGRDGNSRSAGVTPGQGQHQPILRNVLWPPNDWTRSRASVSCNELTGERYPMPCGGDLVVVINPS